MASRNPNNLLSTAAMISSLCFFASCQQNHIAVGPGIDHNTAVTKIVVQQLRSSQPEVIVTEAEGIRSALPMFSRDGWEKPDGELVPHYRIELFASADAPLIYWIGTFSDPPRFPGYWFASGFWLASSGSDGRLDRSAYKPLASSGAMLAVGRLLHGTSERPP